MEKVEEHKRVNGLFKDKREKYVCVRRNIKTSIMHEQSVMYFKDENSGQKIL